MTKVTTALLAIASAAALWASAASAGTRIAAVEDPTPDQSFSGSYDISCKSRGEKRKCREGTQDGHVAVYDDGVVACNGSTDYAPYDQNGDGSNDPLQGYVWVGSNYRATGDKNFETPGGEVGVGSNHGKLSNEPTGKSPCPEADPDGDGPG